ncbi:MAG: YXWGXW repeat-containing protein [Candidatus Eisenbacteria bacterium]|nr:YXWGXW repeat-containing protein [Candidatus Eisenbacteria bacterium]
MSETGHRSRHRFPFRRLVSRAMLAAVATALCSFAPPAMITAGGAGCTRTVYVQTDPPTEAQTETIPPSPGPKAVWIPGHWDWQRGHWAWRPGHWDLNPGGRDWVPGHWDRTRRGWRWVPGHWRR